VRPPSAGLSCRSARTARQRVPAAQS
jgi:hypothetical protein